MKVSTTTSRIADRFDVFTALKIIADAGFDAADFSMFCMNSGEECILNTDVYKEHVLKVKEYAESLGLHFNQAHAPFPTIKEDDEEYNKENLPKVKRAIEIAGLLGIENIVIHPVVFKENQKEKNIELYMSLMEDAKKANVKIALENMFGKTNPETNKKMPNVCSLGEEFAEYYDALPKEHFSCCVDIGHCGLVGSTAGEMIRVLGDRVACLHTHDNNEYDDLHYPPFMFDLNWDDIARALAEIDYNGYITLESDCVYDQMPLDIVPFMAKYMCEAAKKLGRMVEDYKEEIKSNK
jgi:sugar phosphate isomerase/epimerase